MTHSQFLHGSWFNADMELIEDILPQHDVMHWWTWLYLDNLLYMVGIHVEFDI